MAVKMNATTYGTHKDFRKNINIRKKMRHGTKERHINLPPEDFAYGIRNRTPTPIKDVINNGYGNRAEDVIGREYQTFMREKQLVNRLVPKTTPHFNKMMQTRRMQENVEERPLYKMKMFKDVGSKVAEGVKMFKTYHPMKRKDNLDNMIEKVENDIKNEGVVA